MPKDLFPYPQNILVALKHATDICRQVDPGINLFIMSSKRHCATICSFKYLPTGQDLYFIPVEPLYSLSKHRNRRAEANLLCSIYSYLLLVLEIDFFSDECSYLNYHYQTIREGELFDGEDDAGETIAEIDRELKLGEEIHQMLREPRHLRQFKARIRRFQPVNQQQETLHAIAQAAYALYTGNPERTLAGSIPHGILYPYDRHQEDGPIRASEYLSFVWSLRGWMADRLEDWVQTCLQEQYGTDEPMSIQVFDCPQPTITLDLGFVQAVFKLLGDVCELLT